jgi:outer membrane protein OmpA-like peptidoglycan-associated protein
MAYAAFNYRHPQHMYSIKNSFRRLIFLPLLLFCGSIIFAEGFSWPELFFIQGGALGYVAPGELDEYADAKAGFRAGLGAEFFRFRFTVESGYSHIEGTNPLVLDIKMSPLLFKLGYTIPIFAGIGIRPELGAGLIFSRTSHYDTAMDLLLGNLLDEQKKSFTASARLYATYDFPGSFAGIYAGGGLDLLAETGGPIPLPCWEIGASLKPIALGTFIKKRVPQKKIEEPENETAAIAAVEEAPAIRFEEHEENIVIEEKPGQERIVRLLNAVYFEANSVVLIEKYRYVLEEAGSQMKANPNTRITLRAYSAPTGTREGQMAVAGGRALWCEEYLAANYGVSKDRVEIEWYGADKAPEWGNASLESYRCVELLISGG